MLASKSVVPLGAPAPSLAADVSADLGLSAAGVVSVSPGPHDFHPLSATHVMVTSERPVSLLGAMRT
jgi:hypothetical protein